MHIIERIPEHYDAQEMEFGRVYRWCPECVVAERSKCGKRMTFTRSELMDTEPECECGLGHSANVREEVAVRLVDEDYELHHHPWRYAGDREGLGPPY